MGDKPPANPAELETAIRAFVGVADELTHIRDVLTNRTQDLVSGSDAWAGTASEQFQAAWEQFGNDTLLAATTLQRTANTLNVLARDIRNVQTSPPGKLVHAIDTGHVKVVSNMTVATLASNVIHASDAAHAYRVVSEGYDQAAATGTGGFDAAAHATTSGAQLAGGAHSAAVGVSHTGWSAGTHVESSDTSTIADFAQTLAHDSTSAHQSTQQSDDAVPLAPGIFTGTYAGDGASDGAAGFATRAQTSGADDRVSASMDGDEGTNAASPSREGDTASSRIYTRADLGGSPSDATLAAARQQDSTITAAWG